MPATFMRRLSHRVTELPVTRSLVISLRHRGLEAGDAFLASYPKSGNTWVKFMLAHLLGDQAVDFDSVEKVIPDVGSHKDMPRLLPDGGRLIKTHQPFRPSLARHYGRSLYIVRDGRDVAVSYYFSMLRTGLFEGPFTNFLDRFLQGSIGGFGPWHEHVRSWINADPKPLVVRYEDILDDPTLALATAASYLDLSPSTERLKQIVEANTADSMRSMESGTRIERERVRSDINFVRAASSGGWMQHFDDGDIAQFDGVAGDAMRLAGYSN